MTLILSILSKINSRSQKENLSKIERKSSHETDINSDANPNVRHT